MLWTPAVCLARQWMMLLWKIVPRFVVVEAPEAVEVVVAQVVWATVQRRAPKIADADLPAREVEPGQWTRGFLFLGPWSTEEHHPRRLVELHQPSASSFFSSFLFLDLPTRHCHCNYRQAPPNLQGRLAHAVLTF